MRKNKLLIIVRYLALLFILTSLFSSHSSVPVYLITTFLLLLVNSQIRFFSLNRPRWIICSLLLDLALIINELYSIFRLLYPLCIKGLFYEFLDTKNFIQN